MQLRAPLLLAFLFLSSVGIAHGDIKARSTDEVHRVLFRRLGYEADINNPIQRLHFPHGKYLLAEVDVAAPRHAASLEDLACILMVEAALLENAPYGRLVFAPIRLENHWVAFMLNFFVQMKSIQVLDSGNLRWPIETIDILDESLNNNAGGLRVSLVNFEFSPTKYKQPGPNGANDGSHLVMIENIVRTALIFRHPHSDIMIPRGQLSSNEMGQLDQRFEEVLHQQPVAAVANQVAANPGNRLVRALRQLLSTVRGHNL